ncbi:MAG: tetratricopeptide repeat-containing sulfotransferase family protein, partial [Alphaproteobacteria bacterium]
LRLEPRHADACVGMGEHLQVMGRFDESAGWFLRAIDIDPDHPSANTLLARHKAADPADRRIARVAKALARDDLTDEGRATASFALGTIHDEQGRHDEAFQSFRAANELMKKSHAWSAERWTGLLARIAATFTRGLFHELAPVAGSPSEAPLFIVGMPRSGTTLVEQVLASHPRVLAGGERRDINRFAEGLSSRTGCGQPYPECERHLDLTIAREFAARYLAEFGERVAHATRVTDKMPGNYAHLGLIRILFPNARVIHCRRDPLDTCLSMYFQRFTRGNEFSYDLADLGTYCRDYLRLMEHWRAVLPMLEIDYERLVGDLAATAREIVAFSGLNWDERCLTPHLTERPVMTASHWQVRQPVYGTSVGRWRNYERHLGPLVEALGRVESAMRSRIAEVEP